MVDVVYAMGAGAGPGGVGGGSLASTFLMFGLMFAVFYFLLIRPQQKKMKDHKALIDALKKGDRVVTSGGIYGKITGVAENTITLEIADNVRIKIVKAQVGTKTEKGAE